MCFGLELESSLGESTMRADYQLAPFCSKDESERREHLMWGRVLFDAHSKD